MSDRHDNTYLLISGIFLRLLGVIYLIAFASIGVQIDGLIGSQGILPIAARLDELAQTGDIELFLQVPTLFWIDASDATLIGATIAGCLAAVLILLNIGQRAALIAAFILYLSLFHAAQPFLNFQWDALLLESGFLAMFLTPRSRVVIWLFRWLLFRLRFMSGLSKLASGDPAWSGLVALDTYFEVQPLPNPVAWYVHQWPEWLLKAGTIGTLFVELLVPFMMFLPRRWRFTAAWLTIFWQVLIIITSNHNWINFLTIILCLFLFDDRAISRILPGFMQTRLQLQAAGDKQVDRLIPVAVGVLALAIFTVGTLKLVELGSGHRFSGITGKVLDFTTAYSVVNKYHVFPTMTRKRIELEILGSHNGLDWQPYQFKYKPQQLDRRPAFILPHQPRLDWQMWFVTLHPKHFPWFDNFMQALLAGSPSVSKLLAHNPFPDNPPRFLRVEAYEYHFTRKDERERSGRWWKRTALGPFTPLPWMERREIAD
ncbi:MAG: lipase maturation factor family protein [Gammaproteobacteria bacterium]|nr:lipase maturation factor family protein [Gammaproteobacteria bacterium]